MWTQFQHAQNPIYSYSTIVCIFSHSIFSSASEMWYWYGSILLPHSTLLATLSCLTIYKQCSTWLLKVLHKCCNTDVLGVLLIYLHSPSGTACPLDRVYISIKPLAAVLQPINVCILIILCTCILIHIWDYTTE